MRVAAVIPAHNEERTVAAVVDAARRAELVDEVIVVDNASDDGTAAGAERAGATVVAEQAPGKGQAMRTGVAATAADVVVFLDADLVGLTPDHVDALVGPVLNGSAAMTCGLFDRGSLLNRVFLDALPILTGERAMRRETFEALHPSEYRGWRVEAALNSLVDERRLPVEAFVCEGLWHRTKEEKYPNPMVGFLAKQAMLLTAIWGYLVFWMRRRVLTRVRRSKWTRRRSSAGAHSRHP